MANVARLAAPTALCASAFIAATGLCASPAAAHSNIIKISENGPDASRDVSLGLNKAVVIDLPADAQDILVADPKVADAVTRSARRLYVFGKQVGQTNIFVFGAGGRQIVSLDLSVERDVSNLQKQLGRFIPGSDIKVEIINDNIVLTGTVKSPQDSARAAQVANIFVSGGEATSSTASATASVLGSNQRNSQIVNLLQITGQDQVKLKVTVAEVKRNILKQLGLDTSLSGYGALQTARLTNLPGSLAASGTDGAQLALGGNLGQGDISGTLRALEQAQVIRTLAEPTLTAISGESADFHVGGQVYFTTVVDDNQSSLESIDYGIELGFTPVVLSPGRISLKINTEVSEPQSTGQSGQYAKSTRTASTSVELPSGGSIVIAGLLSDNVDQTVAGAPGLSKIPVLGTLFRSRNFQRKQSELVVIATPYLVHSVARNKLARPDDNLVPARDGSGYFMGRVNRIYGKTKTDVPDGRYHGLVGYIYK
ncbi:type II and III secretion system protein family protein [Pararhizobium mangrovi]|uniref:Type II and III secretion system protein family protein n=2 Tax=Pararhizobium mangrovi TaxID=2590452 RepID=A0A506UI12_9HYPH|nr:type II and III secretion system protein family protein [Pararhizobium mangrovi]